MAKPTRYFSAMPRPLKEPAIKYNKPLTPESAFALILREKRLALGLNQADLEDEGMDRSYISKLELGMRQIGLRGILTIAAKLGITPWDLMHEIVVKMSEPPPKKGK